MIRVFAIGPGDRGSIPGWVIAIEKGALASPLTKVASFTFTYNKHQ